MCPTPVCIRTHKNDHVRTLKIPVVHVKFRGLRKKRKDPACTKKRQNNHPVDCGRRRRRQKGQPTCHGDEDGVGVGCSPPCSRGLLRRPWRTLCVGFFWPNCPTNAHWTVCCPLLGAWPSYSIRGNPPRHYPCNKTKMLSAD